MKRNLATLQLLLIALIASPISVLTQPQKPAPSPKDAPAKTQNPTPSDDVVRINVNLVQVDVTVTDDKGRQVTDLKPEDFEVLEENRPQKITQFSYVTPTAPVAATKTPETPPLVMAGKDGKERTAVVAAPVPPVTLRPEQVRRSFALVVDDLGLSHESSVRVRESLRKFVDQQMQPGDLVAIIRTGAGMGALQQFTTDKRLLYAAIDRVRYNLGSRSEISSFAPIGGNGIAVQINDDSLTLRSFGGQKQTGDERRAPSFLAAPGHDMELFREELFSVGTLGALNFVIRGLKDLPGRKSVVLFSDGFKMYSEDPGNSRVLDNLRRLVDLANRASVVFYTIDPRGLQYLGMTAADNLNAPVYTFNPESEEPNSFGAKMSAEKLRAIGGTEAAGTYVARHAVPAANEYYKHKDNIDSAITDRKNDFFQSQHGLSYLASQTGGFLVKNNNDINGAISRVLNDQNGFYLLAYRPDDTGSKSTQGFRNISVRVKRPGVTVRTRKGYFGFTDEQIRRPVRRTAAEQLFAALTSPFKSGDIALRMTALYGYDQQRGHFVQSLVHINTQDLAFVEKPDGTREAKIDVMAVTFGDNGKVIDQDDRPYVVNVGAAEFQNALKEGLVYIVTLPIKKPGAYQLRMAVRDHKSGRVGSSNQFIDVPDAKKGRLLVSGISIRGIKAPSSAGASANPTESREKPAGANDPQTGPAGRRVRRGMQLNYGYFAYNAQRDKATGQPNVSTQLRLFRDGKLVFMGQLTKYNGTAQYDGKQLTLGGSIRLGSDLLPGDYVLQVVVVDHLAKGGQQVATQWIDFDLE